ncbi:MAG: 4Fe-4S dicluster domain-containing protein [Proteobacteria bacterium]|nr:4Fe-4S dicluster domain-containing protein [Pseudomonadota bacterium]
MSQYVRIEAPRGAAAAVKELLKSILEKGRAEAVLVPAATPYSPLPMPTLITDPAGIDDSAPLAPAAPFNAARLAANLARRPTGHGLVMLLRPCELRALIELVKLNQCALDDALVIGMDCHGRMENDRFLDLAGREADPTAAFLKDDRLREEVTESCRGCDRFTPDGADLTVCLFGLDTGREIGLSAGTENGGRLLSDLGYKTGTEPQSRGAAVKDLLARRTEHRRASLDRVAAEIKDVEGFQKIVATCLNCYNCRVACPVCYCRECVFITDVFSHEPEVYLRRARRKGRLKIPTETTMYHLTRLAHMSHACVGCGQCSSACPQGIPVADFFRAVADQTQALFDYIPGLDPARPIPYLAFEPPEGAEG